MMDNERWKGIQSCEKLEEYLRANPLITLHERRDDRESRYILQSGDAFVTTVDGRSVRALWFKLKRQPNGGYQFRKEAPHD